MSAWLRSVTGRAHHFSDWSNGVLECWINERYKDCLPRSHYSTAPLFQHSTSSRGCGSTVPQSGTAVPRLRRRCDSVHPLHFRWHRSHEEDCLDRLKKTTGDQRQTARSVAIRGQE